MNDIESIIDGFTLFNEKADKLFRLSFVKTMFETKTGASFSGEAKEDGTFEVRGKRRGPDEEAIDAFVLTFRFFIQNNERSSFHNLAEYYESPHIEGNLNNDFKVIRQRINDFLDKPADIMFKFNNEELSRRKIMDTFIYGGLSHANDKNKKNLYDALMLIPLLRPLLENEFVYILSIMLSQIYLIKELNLKAHKQLRQEDITTEST